MFGQSLLSAFGIACTTDTDQLFTTDVQTTSTATYQLNSGGTSIPSNTYPLTTNGITFASGKFGNAAGFSSGNASTGDYMKVSNSIYGSSTTVFSWSLWIKCDNTTGTGINIMGNGALAGGQTGYTVYLYNGRLALSTLQSSDQYFPNPESNGTLINDNQWHNIVLTYNNGSFVLYLDGSPNQTGTSSNYINNATPASDTYIGNSFQRGISDGIVNGQIDQVRVFGGTILNQDAVTALYNETTTTATYPYITTEVANPNSIAYYKMSDATDQLGNYNGTATNVNFNTEGKFGFAGAFNGSSSRIILGTSQDFSVTKTGEISFSLWIKTTTSGTGYVFSKGNDATVEYEYFLELLQPSGKLNWRAVNNSDLVAAQVTPNTVVTDGNWHHIVGVIVNNTSVTLYIDGVATTSSSWSGTISYYANNCLIGHGDGIPASGAWFEGDIDQIRIYDSALSASDVTTLYKEVECEPVAINALDQFNPVIYTGNGGTQSVTGVGFKPDFSWVKNRNTSGNSHELADVIRGVNNTLNSNTASGEYNNATYQFNSFDTDGITVTDDAAGNYAVNGNNETYVAWNWKAPLANLSTSFNGSNSTITIANNAVFNFTTPTSLSVWVNRNTTSRDFIIDKGNGSSGSYGWQFEYYNSEYVFQLNNTVGGIMDIRATTTSGTGIWDHVAVTYDSNQVGKIYLNGVLKATDTMSGTASFNTNGVTIGKYSLASGYEFDGKLAQVRFFNSTLSASEVSDLYAEPAASNNTLNYPAGAGCIAAYPLQTNAVDLSGNYSGASSNVTFGQPGYLTSNTDGAIPSTVAANVEAGFSIVSYTATGSTATVGHGLAAPPDLILAKTSNQAYNWIAYSSALGSSTQLLLDLAMAAQTGSSIMASTDPTSTVFTAGAGNNLNYANGNTIIAYCFKSIAGYSKVGSYTSTYPSTTSVYVGFQPRFVMIKSYNQARNWVIHDSARGADEQLYANLNNAEGNTGTDFQFTSTGFNVSGGGNDLDGGPSYSYIYLAIA